SFSLQLQAEHSRPQPLWVRKRTIVNPVNNFSHLFCTGFHTGPYKGEIQEIRGYDDSGNLCTCRFPTSCRLPNSFGACFGVRSYGSNCSAIFPETSRSVQNPAHLIRADT